MFAIVELCARPRSMSRCLNNRQFASFTQCGGRPGGMWRTVSVSEARFLGTYARSVSGRWSQRRED